MVQSVDRALRMVECLVGEPAGLSLTALAGRMGLAVQTTQGLLRTLEHHGLVMQQGRGAVYTVGPCLGAWARTWRTGLDRSGTARMAVSELARRLGEYVILVELRGQSLFTLVEARSDRELAVSYEHCSVERMHVMATGKVLLASLGETRRSELMDRLDLRKHAANAMTDRHQLLKELTEVKRQSWARCRNESSAGIGALAVPVMDQDGGVMAALGCSIPLSRMTSGREKEVVAVLQETADQIAQAWGL